MNEYYLTVLKIRLTFKRSRGLSVMLACSRRSPQNGFGKGSIQLKKGSQGDAVEVTNLGVAVYGGSLSMSGRTWSSRDIPQLYDKARRTVFLNGTED